MLITSIRKAKVNRIVINNKISPIGALILLLLIGLFIAIILSDYTMPHMFADSFSKKFALVFVSIIAFGIWYASVPDEILIIDEKGFFDYSSDNENSSQGFVPWSNVDKVFIHIIEKNPSKKKKKSLKKILKSIKKGYKNLIKIYLILVALAGICFYIRMMIKGDWNFSIYIYSTLLSPLIIIFFIIYFILILKEDSKLGKGKYIGVDIKDITKIYPNDKQRLIQSNIKNSNPMLSINFNKIATRPEEVILIMNRYINKS